MSIEIIKDANIMKKTFKNKKMVHLAGCRIKDCAFENIEYLVLEACDFSENSIKSCNIYQRGSAFCDPKKEDLNICKYKLLDKQWKKFEKLLSEGIDNDGIIFGLNYNTK